jgi:hypothetical protein
VKVHQELRIGPLTSEQETELISWIVGHLSAGWSRDTGREDELNREAGIRFYCFGCNQNAERAAATLLLVHPARRTTSWLYVSNIIPKETRELNYDQYNHILREFHDRFVKPAADSLNVSVELTAPEQSVENWLSPESARRLQEFSAAAIKSTGSSHPIDRERWCDFLIAMHRANENPSVSLLKRWLVEEEKWPEEVAFDLVSEIEFARDLLSRLNSR